MNPLFMDTETTGFGACRVIELAYAHEDGEITSFRCKPPIPIEEQAISVHGITDAMLADLPLFTACPQYAQVKELFEHEETLIVAHNGRFDVDVLERDGIQIGRFIDTKRIARMLYPSLRSHRLQDLRETFFFSADGPAHSAAGDVSVLRQLYAKMKQDIIDGGSDPEDVAEQMLEASRGA